MQVSKFLIAWASTAVFFLAIDSVWLAVVAKNFYRNQLGDLMRESINLPIAALFYVFYSAAVVYLASSHGIRSQTGANALIAGAVLGFAAYGTYDITNLATLKNWPLAMSLVDIVWGTVITAVAAYFGYRVLAAVS